MAATDRRRDPQQQKSLDDIYIRDYLVKSGVERMIRDALFKVVTNRPADPVIFLAEYFASVSSDIDEGVMQAVKCLSATHYTRPTFEVNLMEAYELVTESVSKEDSPGTLTRGVMGKKLNDVMARIGSELPAAVSEQLSNKLSCKDFELVNYHVFKSVVLSTLVLIDFMALARDLYSKLLKPGKPFASRNVAQAIIGNLKNAVEISTPDPVTILEAGTMLSTNGTVDSLVGWDDTTSSSTMSVDEFSISASKIFLKQINKLT